MSLFVLHCLDKPNNLQGRMDAREAHLAYVKDSGASFRMGGPYLDEAGQMVGSLIIIETDDLAAAKAWSANDPYVRAGVFETVEIRPFRVTAGGLNP
ncbi:MAG TPA: YciI family protein [Caulobacteraceae bacterium]|nr:YciI family protein [Caulobacteraceae bacterium]